MKEINFLLNNNLIFYVEAPTAAAEALAEVVAAGVETVAAVVADTDTSTNTTNDINYDGIDDSITTTANIKEVDLNGDGSIDYVEKITTESNKVTTEIDFNYDGSTFTPTQTQILEEKLINSNGNSKIIYKLTVEQLNLGIKSIYMFQKVSKTDIDNLTNDFYVKFRDQVDVLQQDYDSLTFDNIDNFDDSFKDLLQKNFNEKLNITSSDFKTFYEKFLGLYDSSAQESAKNNLKTFFTNVGTDSDGNKFYQDNAHVFNLFIDYLNNDLEKLAKIINLTYNISASYIIRNSEDDIKEFLKLFFIIVFDKFEDSSIFIELGFTPMEELVLIFTILQYKLNFKEEYFLFIEYILKLYDFIKLQLDYTKNQTYDFTHNLTLAIKTVLKYVQTNTLFDLNRIMKRNDNSKFLELLQDSDNDGYFNFADEFPNDKNKIKIVHYIKYYKHKVSNGRYKYVKKEKIFPTFNLKLTLFDDSEWGPISDNSLTFDNTQLKYQGQLTNPGSRTTVSGVPIQDGKYPYKRIYAEIDVKSGFTYTLDNFKITYNGSKNIDGIYIYIYYREFKYVNSVLKKISESQQPITLGEFYTGFSFEDSGKNAAIHELGLKIEDRGSYLTNSESWDKTKHTRTFTLENANNFFTYTRNT